MSKLRTRDGRPARILCEDLNRLGTPIVAAVTDEDGTEAAHYYRSDGKIGYSPIYDSRLDLMLNTEHYVILSQQLNRYVYDTEGDARLFLNEGNALLKVTKDRHGNIINVENIT